MEEKHRLVTVRLTGIQTGPEGISDTNETVEEGRMYDKNGFFYVLTATTRYKFNHRSLEVVKNGDITTKILFEAGMSHTTLYDTSVGSFNFTFKTLGYSLSQKSGSCLVETDYEIEDRKVKISSNHIKLDIELKQKN